MTVPGSSDSIRLEVLGTTDLRGADGEEVRAVLRQPKRLALLVYRVLAEGDGYLRRDSLLGVFWGDRPQERARAFHRVPT